MYNRLSASIASYHAMKDLRNPFLLLILLIYDLSYIKFPKKIDFIYHTYPASASFHITSWQAVVCCATFARHCKSLDWAFTCWLSTFPEPVNQGKSRSFSSPAIPNLETYRLSGDTGIF